MKHAAVYRRRNSFIVHPDGKTTAGVYIGIEPFIVLDRAVEAAAIGHALRRALAGSKDGLRHPDSHEWDAVARPLYEAAGVKNWAAFVKGTSLVHIEADRSVIKLLPQENRGAREGFQPLAAAPIEVSSGTTDHELGTLVMQALGEA